MFKRTESLSNTSLWSIIKSNESWCLDIKTGLHSNFILTRIHSLVFGTRYRSHCCSCTLLLSRSRDPDHVPFPKFFQWSCQHFLESILAELEVRTFSRFRTIALTPKNLPGHVTVTTSTFRKCLSVTSRDYLWEHTCQIWSSYLQPFWSY